jgi:hypothetical protein
MENRRVTASYQELLKTSQVSPLRHSFLFLFTATMAADRRDAALFFLFTTTKADDHRRDAQELRAKAPVKRVSAQNTHTRCSELSVFCEIISPLLCIPMLGLANSCYGDFSPKNS